MCDTVVEGVVDNSICISCKIERNFIKKDPQIGIEVRDVVFVCVLEI